MKSQIVTSFRVGKFTINLADCSDPICLTSEVQSNSCKVFLLSFEYLFTRAELGASHRGQLESTCHALNAVFLFMDNVFIVLSLMIFLDDYYNEHYNANKNTKGKYHGNSNSTGYVSDITRF